MYCEKCGTNNKETDKFCKNCGCSLTGEKIEKEDEEIEEKIPKDPHSKLGLLGFFAVLFSTILWPVGLTLAIIGITKYNKVRKEENYHNPNLNAAYIIAFALSAGAFFITSLAAIVLTASAIIYKSNVKEIDDTKVLGEYTCYASQYSQIPIASASFKNDKFSWAEYSEKRNNVLKGTYRIRSTKIENENIIYKFELFPNYYEINNKKTNLNTSCYVTITTNGKDKANISFERGYSYYCDKIGD